MKKSAEGKSFREISTLVLGAGGSTRLGLGRQKLLQERKGRPLLLYLIETVEQFEWHRKILVTGFQSQKVTSFLKQTGFPDWETMENPYWESRGISSSLALGISSLIGSASQGVLVFLGDTPLVKVESIQAVCNEFQNNPDFIIRPFFENQPGHPVLFPKSWFSKLSSLTGDAGGHLLVEQETARVRNLVLEDPGIHRDFDTQGDFQIERKKDTHKLP